MGIGQRRGGRARGRHRHRARAHHHHRPRNRLVGLRFGPRLNRRGHGGNISNNFGPGFSSPGQMPPELCCHMWMGIFSVMFGLVVFCSLPVFIFGIFSHDAPMGLLIGFPILGSVLIFIGILKVAKTCQALQRETQQTSQEEGNESRLGNDVTSVNMDTTSRLEVEQRTVGAVWTTGQSGVTILPQPVQGQVGYPIGQQTGMGRYGYPTGQLTSLGQTGCPTGQQTSPLGYSQALDKRVTSLGGRPMLFNLRSFMYCHTALQMIKYLQEATASSHPRHTKRLLGCEVFDEMDTVEI